MRAIASLTLLISWGVASGADPVSFDVASVKVSERHVGPDYNNQLAFSPSGITAKNATLRRLLAEAYGMQINQVIGPAWLDQSEYEVIARAGQPVARTELQFMLRTLLGQRFDVKQHGETREMRLYELVIDKGGPKVRALKDGETAKETSGLRFHGEMRQFADFLAVQLSIPAATDPSKPATAGGPTIPVLDKTGLTGTYDFSADITPEPGVDVLNLWRLVLPERFGLRLESRRGPVEVIVVESASRIPTAN